MAKRFIGPEEAQEMLTHNQVNRLLSKEQVRTLATDMVSGRWKYNGEAIVFSDNEILLDGQHRLYAIIMAATLDPKFKGIEIEVVEGVEEAARATIDTGRKRSFADVMHMDGKPNGMTVGSASKFVLNYLAGSALTAKHSHGELGAFVEANPAIFEAVDIAQGAKSMIRPGPLAAVLFLGTRAPALEPYAEPFVAPLLHGQNLSYGDPRLALRSAFSERKARAGGMSGLTVNWSFVAIATAWNNWIGRNQMKALRLQPTAAGDYLIPSILGAPEVGSGVEALAKAPTLSRVLRATLGEVTEEDVKQGRWTPHDYVEPALAQNA